MSGSELPGGSNVDLPELPDFTEEERQELPELTNGEKDENMVPPEFEGFDQLARPEIQKDTDENSL